MCRRRGRDRARLARLGWSAKALEAARATLEAHGDRVKRRACAYLEVRRLLLIGRLTRPSAGSASWTGALPPALRACTSW